MRVVDVFLSPKVAVGQKDIIFFKEKKKKEKKERKRRNKGTDVDMYLI